MPDPTLILGTAVIKTFFRIWLKDDNAAQQISLTLTDLINTKISDVREQRKIKRLFENLEEKIADQILAFLEHEYKDVPSNEREAAIFSATLAFDNANLTVPDIFLGDLDSLYLERLVRRSSPRVTRDLSAGAVQLYDNIIAQCCSYIVEVSNVLPGFEVGVFRIILSRETELLKRVAELLDRVAALSHHDGSDRFENAYRQIVAKKLDHLELFGVTISEAIRTYPLSTAYISLTVNSQRIAMRQPKQQELFLGQSAVETASAEEQNLSIEEALTSTRRLFLRGEAGTGKTTLLQWVAVRAALRDFEEPLTEWNNLVPFLVRLRTYAGSQLPGPEDFLADIGRHIAEEMPTGWVHEKLRAGQAVVLVDGIDELPESERAPARSWLRDLLDSFPDSRFIVTSRPAAVTEAWLDREEFDPAEIQPMTWSDVQALVEQWHTAFLGLTIDNEERRVIRESQDRLLEELKVHRHLLQLAANPLLSALLCALNLDRRTFLPRDRMDVYRVALDMLLERRDVERRILTSGTVLSRRDKLLLLEDLAYWLIRNGWSDAPFNRVAERFDQRLRSMPHADVDGSEAVKILLDRSGIIRRPVVDRVDFIHRTFEEYLAAAAAVDADDIGLLVEHAHDDQWREVIIMAAGHALSHQRNELFEQLLNRAEAQPAHRQIIQALTIACLETAHQVDTSVLARVEHVASRLLPPRTMANAEALALGGDFILDLLSDHVIRGGRIAAATIRLASILGGEKALGLIRRCAAVNAVSVDRELVRAWTSFDPEEYGQEALNGRPLYSLKVNDPILLPVIHYPRVDNLDLEFKRGFGELHYLAELTTVKNLGIHDPLLEDISPIAGMAALTTLELYRTSPLLGDDSISMQLATSQAKVKRFALWTARKVRNLDNLSNLPAFASLDFLVLADAVSLTSIRGIEKWGQTLTGIVLAAPNLEDAERLASLPRLRFINFTGTPIQDISFVAQLRELWVFHVGFREELPDLSPLRHLEKLEYLYLHGRGDVDLSPLAGKENLTVTISNLRARRVLGSADLGEGSMVVNY